MKFTVYQPFASSEYVCNFSSMAWIFKPKEYKQDGICNLKYKIHDRKLKPLYTWIYAEPGQLFGST